MNKSFAFAFRGFKLVKILVALLILGGGLLALAKFQGDLLGGNSLVKQRSEATVLAKQKIEPLRPYDNLITHNNIVSGIDSVVDSSASYAPLLTGSNSASPTQNQVALAVTWRDSGNSPQSAITPNPPLNATPATSSTTSTTEPTTTNTTTTTGNCQCKQRGANGSFVLLHPYGQSAVCTDACCQGYQPQCSGNNCTYIAQCPLQSCNGNWTDRNWWNNNCNKALKKDTVPPEED